MQRSSRLDTMLRLAPMDVARHGKTDLDGTRENVRFPDETASFMNMRAHEVPPGTATEREKRAKVGPQVRC